MKTVCHILTPLVDSLLSVIFPCTCRLCCNVVEESALSVVCRACWNKLKTIEHPFCVGCGYPFASQSVDPGTRCGSCRRQLYVFDFGRSYSPFTDPLKEIVHQFKYCHHPSLARPLAKLLQRVCLISPEVVGVDMIIPVPLHKARERERGYNQVVELGRYLSALTRIPIEPNWLVRTRPTQIQAGLSRRQRRINVKDAFQVSGRAALENQDVLLLDDVFTTGATLNECARILKRNGTRRVNVLTVARVTRQ